MSRDYSQIVQAGAEEKRKYMQEFFEQLIKGDRRKRIEMFKDIISGFAKVTNDREYTEMCRISLQIMLSLDRKTLGDIMDARLEAQLDVTEAERIIDSRNMMKAINEMPQKDLILELIERN